MDISEMFEKFTSGAVAAHSELGTRDEAKQVKRWGSRIAKLKIKTGIKAHAMVFKDMVIPFNPFTGVADDVYNEKNKYRPILLVSQVMELIFRACQNNSELANFWATTLKLDPASVDWTAEPDMKMYLAFKHAGFVKPRIMSFSTVFLNFNEAMGYPKFRITCTVDPSELDENFNYPPPVASAPLHHQACVFFTSMCSAEANEAVKALKEQSANKEAISLARQTVFSKLPVGPVTQTNIVPFIYLPFEEEPAKVNDKDLVQFERFFRLMVRRDQKWGTAFTDVMTNDINDDIIDFFDFTIRTPSSAETKGTTGQVYTDDDVLDLWQALTVTVTDSKFNAMTGRSQLLDNRIVENKDLYAPIWDAAKKYFLYSQEQSFAGPDGDSFEKVVTLSTGFPPITSQMDNFLEACNQIFLEKFADTKYFTPAVKKANAKFFVAMNQQNALDLAEVDDKELDDAAEKQAVSIGALMSEAREGTGEEDNVLPVDFISLPDEEGTEESIEPKTE